MALPKVLFLPIVISFTSVNTFVAVLVDLIATRITSLTFTEPECPTDPLYLLVGSWDGHLTIYRPTLYNGCDESEPNFWDQRPDLQYLHCEVCAR